MRSTHFSFAKRRDLLVHEMPLAEIFALLNECVNQPILVRPVADRHPGIYPIGQRSVA